MTATASALLNPTRDDLVLGPSALKTFHREGFHIARGLFSPGEAAKIRDAFMEAGKNGPVEGLSEFKHYQTGAYSTNDPLSFYPRMMHPHRHMDMPVGPLARAYMLDARVGRILEQLMAEEPVAVQSMFYFKPPGARGQALHQDNIYLRVKPHTCMAAWTAVDDADEGNGGLMVVPGTGELDVKCPEKADTTQSFTADYVRPPEGVKPLPLSLKAGDCLFFNGSVIHGSSPNTSKDRFRRALICHYVPRGSVELSPGYTNPTRFDGTVIQIAPATGGGPCGTPVPVNASPH